VTGRPATKFKPEEPAAKDSGPDKKTSVPAILLLAAIVLIYGFVGWQWFSADSGVSPVYGAALAVERNLTLRRTPAQLSGSVERFSAEIARVRDEDPSEGESEALDNYDQAVAMLNDSLKLWAAKAEHGPALDRADENLAPLTDKYVLLFDDDGKIKAEESLEIIWLKAQEFLDAGNEFYIGS
jgi:hypothetical protein